MLKYQAKYEFARGNATSSTVQFLDLTQRSITIHETDVDLVCSQGERELVCELMCFIAKGQPVPIPYPEEEFDNDHNAVIRLSLSNSLKVLVWNEMLRKGYNKNTLAKKMGPDTLHEQVSRLFNLAVFTGVEMFDRALMAMDSDLAIVFKK